MPKKKAPKSSCVFLTLHFKKLEADSILISRAIPLIEKHSINSTDACVLRSAMDIAAFEKERGNELSLVTADKRLDAAAKSEGLHTINPEMMSLTEIEALFSVSTAPTQ